MSNSSEDRLIAGLLDGLVADCAAMADEIDRLADFACETVPMTDAGIVTLQAFDPLSQSVRAQARLLAGLAVLLRGGHVSHGAVSTLIDALPIPLTRHRLYAVLGAEAAP